MACFEVIRNGGVSLAFYHYDSAVTTIAQKQVLTDTTGFNQNLDFMAFREFLRQNHHYGTV
jgi:hypothetical protein